ncbi:MAG TPA: hypothetical protein VER12_06400 [Polyangiaceae bacterium]|nr:hypothetical protein [Polyangiaceae bacterium]
MKRARVGGRLGLGLLALWLTNCAARTPALPAAPPVPVAPPTPSAGPAEPPPGNARYIDAIPADLNPELAQQIGFLSDLCNVAMHYETEGAHRVRVGCRTCPPFEGPAAISDGRIAVDGKDFFELELYVVGHFTAANAEQRLAVFKGCELPSSNRGGTLIAERTADKFRALRYFAGVRPQACEAYHRPDGRDLAVCEFTEAHQSSSSDTLGVLDFAADPPKQQTLLSFTNQDPCLTEPGTRTSEEVIESFELNQNPAARNNGLVVRTTRAPRTMDAQYQRYCRETAAGGAPGERPYSKPQVTTRQYIFNGESFVPR